jgi:hypothetical protein
VEHFLDEPSLEELPQPYSDRLASLFVEAAQPLLYGAGVRSDVKGVIGDLPRDAWHI